MLAHRLNATRLANLKEPGRYADGNGLWLQVKARVKNGKRTKEISRSWLYRYMVGGRAKHMGLGPYPAVSLAEARDKAQAALKARIAGADPLDQRRAEKASASVAAAKLVTFDDCAKSYIAAHQSAWRNGKHRAQWGSTLKTYVAPTFGALPVAAVDTGLVLKALEPIWAKVPETATRVRQRVEAVLDWARVRGYRDGENPARWKGHLDHLLPSRSKVRKVRHHPAMAYPAVGAFLAELRDRVGSSARALEFTILTAARTEETIGATWPEIDLAAAVWTLPPERMKADREHRVPLSDAAVRLLEAMHELRESDDGYLFAGADAGRGLSNMAMLELLRGMRPGLTVHGFRSTFRDWAAERTAFEGEVVEMALAHVIKSKTEAAYRRGDLFDKRRELMREWARYCGFPQAVKNGL